MSIFSVIKVYAYSRKDSNCNNILEGNEVLEFQPLQPSQSKSNIILWVQFCQIFPTLYYWTSLNHFYSVYVRPLLSNTTSLANNLCRKKKQHDISNICFFFNFYFIFMSKALILSVFFFILWLGIQTFRPKCSVLFLFLMPNRLKIFYFKYVFILCR